MSASTRANVILSLTDNMSGQLRGVSAKLDRMAVRARRAGMAMGAGAIVLGTGLFKASKSAVELDNNMREVQARMSGISPAGLKELRDEAKRLGGSTRYTIGQVSAMMKEFSKAGVSKDGILSMSGAMLSFATATGIAVDEATKLALRTATQFGMPQDAESIVAVTDALAFAANNAQVTVTELGEGMTYAGSLAKEYGQTLEDTLAIMAMMGNVGITGSMSGTTMNRMFQKLSEGGVVVNGVAIEMEALDGSMRSVPNIFRDIGRAMEGMGDLEKVQAMNDIFGRLGVKGAVIGISQVEALTKLGDKMQEIKGYSASLAEIIDSGIGGTLWRVVSAVDAFGVAVAEKVLPIVNSVAKVFNRMVTSITPMIGGFDTLGITIISVFAGLSAGAAALLTFAGVSTVLASAFAGVSAIVTGIGAAISGIVTFGTALAGLPMLAVLGVVTGIVVQAGLLKVAFHKAYEAFSEFLRGINLGAGGITAALEMGEFTAAWQLTMDTMELAAEMAMNSMSKKWKEHFKSLAKFGKFFDRGFKDVAGLGEMGFGTVMSGWNEAFGDVPEGTREEFQRNWWKDLADRREAEEEFDKWLNSSTSTSEKAERLKKKTQFTLDYLEALKKVNAEEKEMGKSGSKRNKGVAGVGFTDKDYDRETERLMRMKTAYEAMETARKEEESKFEKVNFDTRTTFGAVGGGSVAAASSNLARGMNQIMKDQLGTLVRIEKTLKKDRDDKGIWMP